MDAYYETLDKIGEAIIDWSDPSGKFRADREVSALITVLDNRQWAIGYGGPFPKTALFTNFFLEVVLIEK